MGGGKGNFGGISKAFRSKVQKISSNLPKNPNTLIKKGWIEKTDIRNLSANRDFENSNGLKLHFDKEIKGAPGFRGKDHYHLYNPNTKNDGDLYLDQFGNSVAKGSKASHLLPKNQRRKK